MGRYVPEQAGYLYQPRRTLGRAMRATYGSRALAEEHIDTIRAGEVARAFEADALKRDPKMDALDAQRFGEFMAGARQGSAWAPRVEETPPPRFPGESDEAFKARSMKRKWDPTLGARGGYVRIPQSAQYDPVFKQRLQEFREGRAMRPEPRRNA